MFFFRRLFLKDRAGKFRGKILSGRKSGPGRKSGMSDTCKIQPLQVATTLIIFYKNALTFAEPQYS